MAYVPKSLRAVLPLGVPYDTAAGPVLVPRLLHYSTPDTLATVTGAGYFNGAVVAGQPADLMVGDVLVIQHTTGGARGTAIRAVTAIAAGVVTIAALG